MTMAMELIRHIAGLYSGKAIKGDFTQVYIITGNEIWMAQQVLAEQADGVQGERERFEVEMLELFLPIERDSHGAYVSDHVRHLWSGWELRAALAQPSQIRCQCCGYLVTDSEHRSCLRAAQQPSPAPELAVLERWGSSYEAFSPDLVRQDTGRYVKFVDAERIVGALRNELESERDLAKVLQEQIAALSSTAEDAQARVAELEKQEPVYTKPSWADNYGWSGGYIDFKCATDVERLARHFEDLLDAVPEGPLYAAPVAQAGQVPDILTDEDMKWLRRFSECCEDIDADGHDLPRGAVKRLVRAGALRHCGGGITETTAFGDWLLTAATQPGAQFTEQHQTLTQGEQTAGSANHQPAKRN